MHTERTQRRIPAVYLWGALFVLAWSVLTALTSGPDARADDDQKSPLGGLTSVVSQTVGEVVTPVVKSTTTAIAEAAAPVVETVKATVATATPVVESVPVVGKPVTQVVAATGSTVAQVTETVSSVVAESPVSAIVAPVTDAVSSVPVVGDIVAGTGVVDLVDDVATGVDGVLGTVPPVVDSTVDPVVDGLQPGPSGPGVPWLPGVGAPVDADPSETGADSGTAGTDATVVAQPATAESGDPAAALAPPAERWRAAGLAVASTRAAVEAADAPGIRALTPPVRGGDAAPSGATPSTSSAGSGGSSGTPNADGPAVARLGASASSRTGIPADAELPASPAGSTDVSPD